MQFSDVTNLVSLALVAYGGFLFVPAIIGIILGFKDHEGSKIQASISNAVAGGIIILVSQLVTKITL